MNRKNQFSGDEKKDDESIYYYMPTNQENIKSEVSSKNLEPQDNIKKITSKTFERNRKSIKFRYRRI